MKSLTFRDGFNFGCGLWASAFIFFAIFLPMVSVAIIILMTIVAAVAGR